MNATSASYLSGFCLFGLIPEPKPPRAAVSGARKLIGEVLL